MKASDFFSLPNLLCYLRIILIPFFMYNYIIVDNYEGAIITLIIMELSDFLDGFIARKFNLITDWGKIIDPVADKLLQLSLLVVLAYNFKFAVSVLVLFIVKEVISGILALWSIKRSKIVEGARFWGKIATVVFYLSALFLVLFPNTNENLANGLLFITALFLLFAFIKYSIFFISIIINHKKK